MTRGHLAILLGVVAISAAIVWRYAGVVVSVNDLFPGPLPGPWYPVQSHRALVYLAAPAVLVAALILFWAPGLSVTLGYASSSNTGELALKSFLVASGTHFVTFSTIKLLAIGGPPTRAAWLGTVIAVNALALGALARRVARGKSQPLSTITGEWRQACWMGAACLLALYLLLPFLFWQDLNPDGVELLTLGRSLESHFLPRLPTGLAPGLGVGMVAAAYPVHWFVALFGPIEVAARLPVLLYVPALLAGLLALITTGAPRPMRGWEEATLVLGLAVVVASMALNNAYHPYGVDLASPAGIDFLAVVGMLATAYFAWTGNGMWMMSAALLTYMTRSSALLFLVLLGLGFAIAAPEIRRTRLRLVGVALLLCGVIGIIYSIALEPATMGSVARRLRYLTLTDTGRVVFLLVPAGLIPPVALLLLRWQDRLGRVLCVVTVGYFALFYPLAFVALHHFLPVMILPLAIYWRLVVHRPARPLLVTATAVAAAAAIWMVVPKCVLLDRTLREIGQATRFDFGHYAGTYAEYRTAFEHKDLFGHLFRPWYEVEDPSAELIGSAWVLVHYASAPKTDTAQIEYVLQPMALPPPGGFERVAAEADGAVYVRDTLVWQRDRTSPPTTQCRSPVLFIPDETLYRRWGEPRGNYTIDLRELLRRVQSGFTSK